MMPLQPNVSVIIPVYNVETYLRPCLDSVISQTLQNIEIICVDDGSTDTCPFILDEYAQKDARIKVIHKRNGGYGQAVNLGMDTATGKYIAILESDDFIRDTMYERLFTLADKYALDIVKSDFERFVIRKDGSMKTVYASLCNTPDMYNRVIENDAAYVLKNAALYNWSGIFRLDFLREHQIRHNESAGASYQDNGFWFQSMAMARRVYFLNEAFYMLRRDNPNSSIHSKSKVYCIRDEYEFILAYLQAHPDIYHDLIGVYWWARVANYRFNYLRISLRYKAEFAKHFAETISLAVQQEELDWNLFSTAEKKDISTLLSGWRHFHLRNWHKSARDPMQTSFFHRILWYIEDNGIIYTFKQAIRKGLRFLHK